MKRGLFTLVVTLSLAVASFAQDAAAPSPRRRRPAGKPTGGLLQKEYTGKTISIVNATKSVSDKQLNELAEKMRLSSRLPIFVVGRDAAAAGKSPIEQAEAAVKAGKVSVVVVSEGAGQTTLLAAPENAWAVLNTTPLAADFPSDERLNARLSKELWRAVGYSLGIGSASIPCVMGSVHSLADLDRALAVVSPETTNKLIDSVRARGAGLVTIASYRSACKEGWAPAPTNDVQKAVWKEVHEMPTKPITIEPEKKPAK